MSRLARCDTCRGDIAMDVNYYGGDEVATAGWFHLWSPAGTDIDFCSWKCLADYVTVAMLVPPGGDDDGTGQ